MKKLILGLIIISIVALLAVGCVPTELGGSKTTGGGWFIGYDTEENLPTEGNYVTFGFNVRPVGEPYPAEGVMLVDVKGQFQMIDHTLGMRLHGVFLTGGGTTTITDSSIFIGDCFVDGDGPHTFFAYFDNSNGASFVSIAVDMDDNGDIKKDTDDIQWEGIVEGVAISIHTNGK